MTLEDLNALTLEAATREMVRCCGSRRWARTMAERRPFDSPREMAAAADEVWWSLQPADWLEAFAAHPRIGGAGQEGSACGHAEAGAEASSSERAGGGPPAPVQKRWAATEQSGMNAASDEVRRRLAGANGAYEARFGYIFIVCATGRSADDMLAILERRLANAPGDELDIAAEEQQKITRLRLDKLLT